MSESEEGRLIIDSGSEATVNVMEGYPEEEELPPVHPSKDELDESSSSSTGVADKPLRKKFKIAGHINTIPGSAPCYFCTFCKRYFSHKRTANNHQFCGTGKKPYKCKLCDERFVKKCDRDSHLSVHTGESPYTCDVCKKSFRLKHKLSRHVRSHTKEKGDFTCKVCFRTFLLKEALKKHEVTKHNSLKRLQCENCKRNFKTLEDKSCHKCFKLPPRENLLICEVCGKTFNKRYNLKVHSRTHQKLRPYQCPVCNKNFRVRQHLVRHSVQHQNELEADFECKLCRKAFGRKDNLLRHLKLNHFDIDKEPNKLKRGKKRARVAKSSKSSTPKEPPSKTTTAIIAFRNLPNIRYAKTLRGTPGELNSLVRKVQPEESNRRITRSRAQAAAAALLAQSRLNEPSTSKEITPSTSKETTPSTPKEITPIDLSTSPNKKSVIQSTASCSKIESPAANVPNEDTLNVPLDLVLPSKKENPASLTIRPSTSDILCHRPKRLCRPRERKVPLSLPVSVLRYRISSEPPPLVLRKPPEDPNVT